MIQESIQVEETNGLLQIRLRILAGVKAPLLKMITAPRRILFTDGRKSLEGVEAFKTNLREVDNF